MEMELPVLLAKLQTRVTLPRGRNDNILAFGELYFYESGGTDPLIKIKGFTIKRKIFGEKEVVCVDFPAFGSPRSRSGFQTSFIVENRALLEDIRSMFLDEYKKLSDNSPEGVAEAAAAALG